MEEVLSIGQNISRQILRRMGQGHSTCKGENIHNLLMALNTMMADLNSRFGDDYVKNKWIELGRDWKKTEMNLKKLEKKTFELLGWTDALRTMKLSRKDKRFIEHMRSYRRIQKKIPLLMEEFYDLYVWLIKQTAISRMSIPAQDYRATTQQQFAGKKIKTEQAPTVSQESD